MPGRASQSARYTAECHARGSLLAPSRIPARAFGLIVVLLSICASSGANAEADTAESHSATRGIREALVDAHRIQLPIVDSADIRFLRFETLEGPSKSNAGPLLQDNQGFIWFGTPYGLNRFDGYTFRMFTHDPKNPTSISCSLITALFKDRAGVLWVGCNHFLNRLNTQTETFTQYPVPYVFDISQDASGKLWLSTPTGLYTLDPASGDIRRYVHDPSDPASLESNDIKSTGEDREGQFWVATSEGLDAFDRSTGRVTLRIPIRESSYPFSFYEDRYGVFWIYHVSGDSLAVYDRKTNVLTGYSFQGESPSASSVTGVTGMLEDKDGTLWLSTNGGGLLKFDRSHQRFIGYRHRSGDSYSLAQNSIRCMFADREGVIWLSLGGYGLTRFTPKPLAFLRYRSDFGNAADRDEPFVGAILEDDRGILWIGTHSALHRIDRRTGKFADFALTGRGQGTDAISICQDRSGNLWIGTYGHGLFRLDPRTLQIRRFRHDPQVSSSLSNDIVTRVFVDRHGNVWAATHDGLDRYDAATGKLTTYRTDVEGIHPYYLGEAEDSRGIIWLGTESSGLLRFDPRTERFQLYQHQFRDPHSLSDNRVNSIYFDRTGTMWVGTQEGLDRFEEKSASFISFSRRDGLPGNVVSCILQDDRGHLWMSTENGIAKFDPQTYQVESYSTADGLPGPDLTGWGTCFRGSRDEMFFGGFNGATAFFPQTVTDSSWSPPVALTDFRLFGSSVLPGGGSPLNRTINYTDSVTLTHNQNRFSVGFSALSYLNPAANRYRYMLQPLDKRWIQVGTDERIASYTTLPVGTYTFEVQGATSRGPWSEPGVRMRIEILPAWYQTIWFRSICVLAFLALLWSIYLLRLQELERQFHTALEARVGERTRIARELHDTMLQSFLGVMMKLHTLTSVLDRPAEVRKRLEGILEQGQEAINEGRAAVQGMRSSTVIQNDLAYALVTVGETLAAEQNSHSPVDFRVVVKGESRDLHPILRDEVYRIAREATCNAFRHSGAGRIKVEICYDKKQLRVLVQDNGKGIDAHFLDGGGREGHFGLPGMRERAKLAGGKLTVRSKLDSGTEIELTIPASTAYSKSPAPGSLIS
ncbi:MAG: hypothetical protein JOY95_01160 [Silvibacterium sp.]|nr:hypothetical protein [Silvibacterium sp.]